MIDQGVTNNHPDLQNTRQLRLNGSNFIAGQNNPWLVKVQESTFFPPTWDEQKVLNDIQSAFDKKVKVDTDPTKNRWTGTYTDITTNITIQIQLFLKPNNEIITAFPKF